MSDEKPKPKGGDCVLFCAHAGPTTFEAGGYHWFWLDPKDIPFARRPDGIAIYPRFIRLCGVCFARHGGALGSGDTVEKNGKHLLKIPVVAGDALWPDDLEVNYEKSS